MHYHRVTWRYQVWEYELFLRELVAKSETSALILVAVFWKTLCGLVSISGWSQRVPSSVKLPWGDFHCGLWEEFYVRWQLDKKIRIIKCSWIQSLKLGPWGPYVRLNDIGIHKSGNALNRISIEFNLWLLFFHHSCLYLWWLQMHHLCKTAECWNDL